MEYKNGKFNDAVQAEVAKFEKFKKSLRGFLDILKHDKVTRTLEELETVGISFPTPAIRIPDWWSNSGIRAPFWTEIGWKTKVTTLEGKIYTITFARGDAAKDMPEIEDITPHAAKEEISQQGIQEKSDVSEVLKRDYLSIINKNIFGFVSIFIAILVFIARFNFFTYAAVVGICLVGVLIGLMGTRHSKKPILAYIGVVLCLLMLLELVLWMNYILENLD